MNDKNLISPALAARLVELEDHGLECQVVSSQPDAMVVLVKNGDPEPFLMTVSLDALPKTQH